MPYQEYHGKTGVVFNVCGAAPIPNYIYGQGSKFWIVVIESREVNRWGVLVNIHYYFTQSNF